MNDNEPLIDTNVLVHAYVLSNEKRHAMATCRGRRGQGKLSILPPLYPLLAKEGIKGWCRLLPFWIGFMVELYYIISI
ncbi:MAG TPA: hypothetical protein ACFYD6_02275 [Candidatus Brocadiia bacterium]|nr:hypothetical protein [Planctomycetota bacterium]MDO8094135.1 hypothetical protein [Candidatus Brocadiales bacterium]